MSVKRETERKFAIEMPSISTLCAEPGYTASEILQIYLKSADNTTRRIRRRAYSEAVEYTETKKIRVSPSSAMEDERIITEEEFLKLSAEILENTRPIIKARHSFKYGAHIIEIDIYPDWKNHAVMEIELAAEDEEIEIPDFIHIVAELTGNRAYSNAAMAHTFPPPPEP